MAVLTSPEGLLTIYSEGSRVQTCQNENACNFPKELKTPKYKYALNAVKAYCWKLFTSTEEIGQGVSY